MSKEEVLYEVKGPKNIHEMTAYELKDKLKETDLFLMSCGATENHSFHLPIGSDNYQGDYLIRRIAEKLKEMGIESIPGFTVPFGAETNSFERDALFGNCSLKPSTLVTVLKELIVSLHRHGLNKFVMILNHAENWGPMQTAAQELYEEKGIVCLCVNWIPPMNDFWPTVLKNTKHQGHGGEDETACVMAAVPNLVNAKDAAPWYHDDEEDNVEFSGLFYYGGAAGIYAPLKPDHSPGYVGDPASATVEAGEACYSAYAEWIAKVIRKYFY